MMTPLRQAVNSICYARISETSGAAKRGLKAIVQTPELPFTSKEDLRNGFPWGSLSSDKKNVVRLHSSSGMTGNPTVFYHRRHDFEIRANMMARSVSSAEVRNTEVFLNGYGFYLFTGDLGFQCGVEKLGSLSIPAGAGNGLRQIKLIRDFGITVVHAIPSYLGRLVEVFKDEGLTHARTPNCTRC